MLKMLRGESTLAETQKALFAVAALVVVLAMTSFGSSLLLLQRQIADNHATLHRIEQSRLESCRRTYTVLRELIAASADADNKHLTPAQGSSVAQYERFVDPRHCVKDVK